MGPLEGTQVGDERPPSLSVDTKYLVGNVRNAV
jgi:hypothetical protein